MLKCNLGILEKKKKNYFVNVVCLIKEKEKEMLQQTTKLLYGKDKSNFQWSGKMLIDWKEHQLYLALNTSVVLATNDGHTSG